MEMSLSQGLRPLAIDYRCFAVQTQAYQQFAYPRLVPLGTAHHKMLRFGGRCPPYILWPALLFSQRFTTSQNDNDAK